MVVWQKSKMGFLALAMTATAACGRTPLLPQPTAMATTPTVAAAGFEFSNLSPSDVAVVKQAMAKQHPGFTVRDVTGSYLRLGFHFTAKGIGPDGKPLSVSGTWLPQPGAVPDGVQAVTYVLTAVPQPQMLAIEKALQTEFFTSRVAGLNVHPLPQDPTQLQVSADVTTRLPTRSGIDWQFYTVLALFDVQSGKLTVTKRTLVKQTHEPFNS